MQILYERYPFKIYTGEYLSYLNEREDQALTLEIQIGVIRKKEVYSTYLKELYRGEILYQKDFPVGEDSLKEILSFYLEKIRKWRGYYEYKKEVSSYPVAYQSK